MLRTSLSRMRGHSVGLVALFVALSGTSYAAVSLTSNSVGAKHIKAGAVTSSEIRDGTIKASDLAPGVMTAGSAGQQGQQGQQGAQGQPGAQGAQGPKGDVGPKGDRGPAGPTGPQGPKGDKGEKGDKGDKGDKGEAGAPATKLFGRVNSGGGLITGQGITSSSKIATGTYAVYFNRSIAGCAAQATGGWGTHASITHFASPNNRVDVLLVNQFGSPVRTDSEFSIALFC